MSYMGYMGYMRPTIDNSVEYLTYTTTVLIEFVIQIPKNQTRYIVNNLMIY